MANQFFARTTKGGIPFLVVKGACMVYYERGHLPTEIGVCKSLDEFELEVAARIRGDDPSPLEARIGWIDGPLLRFSLKDNDNVLLASPELLNGCPIKLCVGYRYVGQEPYVTKDINLHMHNEFCTAIPGILKDCQAVFKEFAGWIVDSKSINSFNDLPKEFRIFHEQLESLLNAKVHVAVGSLILSK